MEDEVKDVFSVFLSLGSNLGYKEKNIENAYKKIEKQIGKIKSASSFFYSSPVGFISVNDFVNTVCEVETDLNIYTVFAITQNIEIEMGRVGTRDENQYFDRIIDIDIIMVNDLIIDTPKLKIPHPKFHERDFVLTPLNEIASYIIHPILKKNIQEIKNEYDHNHL